jgi:multiple sugar transport system permease protein
VQTLFLVILPNILPGLVATVTFAFLLAWGDVLWALCLIHDAARQPMTLGILQLIGQFRVDWAQIMAATVIASAIPALFYVLLQRYLVQGFAGSAVKD